MDWSALDHVKENVPRAGLRHGWRRDGRSGNHRDGEW